jgi:uncharacterized membrane protein YesL
MGLFGGNFSKPGPGVDRDAPRKKGIFLYFELFFRKIWKIVQVNTIYFLFSLPLLALLYVFLPIPNEFIANMAASLGSGMEQNMEIVGTLQVGFRAMFAIGLFALWGSGPASAGYAYVMRCFTREQHAWIWSDFWQQFKSNFKQAIVVVIVDIVALLFGLNALLFYFHTYQATGSGIWLFICYFTFLMLLIYTFMHYYIYQMMVTFQCTIGQLYKNSLLFAFAKLPMNLLLTAIGVVLIYLAFMIIPSPILSILLSLLIWVSVVGYPMQFYAARTFERTLLNGAIRMKENDREPEITYIDGEPEQNEEEE